MTVRLVTGHTGSEHITSADVGALLAGAIGPDAYVLGDMPTLTVRDANHVSVGPCDLVVQGRHVRITEAEDVTIESGTPGTWRHDLVCLRYSVSDTVESMALGVVKGAAANSAGAAADPSVPPATIGAAESVTVPMARVTLDGLTPTVAAVVSPVNRLSATTSLTRVRGIWTGTAQGVTNGNGELTVLTNDEIRRITGSGWDWKRDWCGMLSGHTDGMTVTMGAAWTNLWGGQLRAECLNPAANGARLANTWILVNYVIVKGA